MFDRVCHQDRHLWRSVRPEDVARGSVAGLLGVVLSVLVACGGTEVDRLDLTFQSMGWSDRVRPDLNPLDPGQFAQPLQFFSDGGDAGDQLVSALYPGEVDAATLRQMPFANVLWIPTGSSIHLSYEVVVSFPHFGGRSPLLTDGPYSLTPTNRKAQQMAVSTRGVTKPVTRELVVYVAANGDTLVLVPANFTRGYFPFPTTIGVALEACTDGAARHDPNDPPQGLDMNCSRALIDATSCNNAALSVSYFPTTVLNCQLQATTDTSGRLVMVDATDPSRNLSDLIPGAQSQPLALLPHIKVVNGQRVLARQVSLQDQACRMLAAAGSEVDCSQAALDELHHVRACNGVLQAEPGDHAPCIGARPGSAIGSSRFNSLRDRWSFTVADPAGAWTENFAPRVRADYIMLYTQFPNGPKRYLRPRDIHKIEVNPGSAVGGSCTVSTDPGGAARINASDCGGGNLNPVTVAWVSGDPTHAAVWTVTFGVDGQQEVIGRACGVNGEPINVCHDIIGNVLNDDVPIIPGSLLGTQLFIEFHITG
jgi:hypothetical protein